MADIPRPLIFRPLTALAYQWQALIVVVVGTFMVGLDATAVNIALPQIIAVFGAPINQAQFVLTGYMLALAVVIPATGYLVDTFGSKRIYILSIVFFTLGSVLCAAAWDVTSLVLFRVVQGLGGGMLMPLGLTIIFKSAPPDRRGTVMSVFGMPMVLAPIIGPTLGGYLVEYVDWRMIFTLNIPVGILGVLMGSSLLRETERRPDLRFDWRGFVLSATGFSFLLYGLANAPTQGWTSPFIVGLLGLGLAIAALWVWVELTDRSPLLDLRIFQNYGYALATVVTFVIAVAMFSTIFLIPLYLQNLRGLGPLETGLLLVPQAIASGLTMPLAGRLFDRFGARPLVLTGLTLVAFAAWNLHNLGADTPLGGLWAILALQGAGMGLIGMPVTTVALNSVPPHLVARGSSLTVVMRQLFASFGTAMIATLLQSRQAIHLAELTASGAGTPPQALFAQASALAFQECFAIAAGLAVVGLIPAFLLRGKGRASPGQSPPPAE